MRAYPEQKPFALRIATTQISSRHANRKSARFLKHRSEVCLIELDAEKISGRSTRRFWCESQRTVIAVPAMTDELGRLVRSQNLPEVLRNLPRKNFGAGGRRRRTRTRSFNRRLADFSNATVILPLYPQLLRGATAMPFGHTAFHRAGVRLRGQQGNRRRRPSHHQRQQSDCRAPVDGANNIRRMEIPESHCLIQGVTGKTLHCRRRFRKQTIRHTSMDASMERL